MLCFGVIFVMFVFSFTLLLMVEEGGLEMKMSAFLISCVQAGLEHFGVVVWCSGKEGDEIHHLWSGRSFNIMPKGIHSIPLLWSYDEVPGD